MNSFLVVIQFFFLKNNLIENLSKFTIGLRKKEHILLEIFNRILFFIRFPNFLILLNLKNKAITKIYYLRVNRLYNNHERNPDSFPMRLE